VPSCFLPPARCNLPACPELAEGLSFPLLSSILDLLAWSHYINKGHQKDAEKDEEASEYGK